MRDAPSGAWVSHFCNGRVHQSLTLKRGMLAGPCTRFDEDGRKLLDGEYAADEKSGAWREYGADRARFESHWRAGDRDGDWRWLARVTATS